MFLCTGKPVWVEMNCEENSAFSTIFWKYNVAMSIAFPGFLPTQQNYEKYFTTID